MILRDPEFGCISQISPDLVLGVPHFNKYLEYPTGRNTTWGTGIEDAGTEWYMGYSHTSGIDHKLDTSWGAQ